MYFTQEYFKGQSLRELMNEYLAAGKAFTLKNHVSSPSRFWKPSSASTTRIWFTGTLSRRTSWSTKPAGPAGQVVRSIKITDVGLADIVNPSIFAEGHISREERGIWRQSSRASAWTGHRAPTSTLQASSSTNSWSDSRPADHLAPTTLRDDLPEHVDDVVEVAMAAEPADRYPTPQDMINDLQQSFQGLIVSAKPRTSLKNIMIGLGTALAVVGIAGLYASTITPEEQRSRPQSLRSKPMTRSVPRLQRPIRCRRRRRLRPPSASIKTCSSFPQVRS